MASKPGTGFHKPVKSKGTVRKGDARLYEPPVYCAAEGCNERLTIAAVLGDSRHHSRVCAGYAVATEKRGYVYGSGVDPDDADLEPEVPRAGD